MELLDQLKEAAAPAPAGFKPGITFQGAIPSGVVTPPLPAMDSESEYTEAVRALGYPIPDGFRLVLVEMQLVHHENFWTRENQGDDATTKPSSTFRYRFKVVPAGTSDDPDIATLMAEATLLPPVERVKAISDRTLVVSLADFQTGKACDERGGTAELLARSEAVMAEVARKVVYGGYEEVMLLDAGDSTEGFESAPNADRTNDLSQTEQIRVWRRILWRWVSTIAPLTPNLVVASVGSNHCSVRRGKANLGDALDDWGIEVLSQVEDIANASPLNNIEFYVPEKHTEHLILVTASGKTLGLMHGHQSNNPNGLPEIIKKNSRRGIGQADVVVVGHFHHFRAITMGQDQTLFVSPTMDAGSSWYQYSGEHSRPGVLTFEMDENGWTGLDIIWADELAFGA